MCKRNIDKLDKYLKTLCKKYNGNFIGLEDGKSSAYYSINGRVIRVSDHIGKNSSGNIHFIITNTAKPAELEVTFAKLGIVPLVMTLTVKIKVTFLPLVMLPISHFPDASS